MFTYTIRPQLLQIKFAGHFLVLSWAFGPAMAGQLVIQTLFECYGVTSVMLRAH